MVPTVRIPRRVRPVRAHPVVRVVVACLVGLLVGCGPNTGLRVEEAQVKEPPEAKETLDAGPADEPYDIDAVRNELLENPTVSNVDGYDELHDVILACTDCLEMDRALMVLGEKFQMAKVVNPTDRKQFAAVIIGKDGAQPKIELILTGNDLSVTPGRGGTLVSQESVYKPTDHPCCPSGWSVRVYRYHDGKFEAGQRIGQLN